MRIENEEYRGAFGLRRTSRSERSARAVTAVQPHRARSAFSILNSQFSIRPGFSLAELMIAIVILGIGLLIVAGMFPVAWTKARDLSEFTTSTSCTEAAETTVKLLTRVANVNDPGSKIMHPKGFVPSFWGDDSGKKRMDQRPKHVEPWVHALHLTNYDVNTAWPTGTPGAPPTVGDFVDSTGSSIDPYDLGTAFFNDFAPPGIQVAIQDRVYPPLPPPPSAGATFAADAARWKTMLNQRRYCWAVLHKMDYDAEAHLTPYLPSKPVPPTRSSVRSFTMYYVTLRRGQDSNRYARQDPAKVPAHVNAYNMNLQNAPTAPGALDAAEDVMWPVPWRVDIEIRDPSPPGLTGLPGEAYTNDRLVTEMLPRGAYMVDERSGMVYKVAKREVDPANPDQAVLTLDQPIPLLEDEDRDGNFDHELIRTVWVFPPAIERDGSEVFFTGAQPVAGIEVRTMVFAP